MNTMLPEHMESSRLINFHHLQKITGISARKLFYLIASRNPNEKIPSYKIGRSRRFKYDEIMWWLEKRKD